MTKIPRTSEFRAKKLTRAETYLLELLKEMGQSTITHYGFFRLVQKIHRERKNQNGESLYLGSQKPTIKKHYRYLMNMNDVDVIRYDEDYGDRLIRILVAPGQLAEDVVCSADPLCYVSHLSAMHRWGLTDRSSDALICTRPSKKNAVVQLSRIMSKHPDSLPPKNVRLYYIGHPKTVRGRAIRMFESKNSGASINLRGTGIRIATIGQTFLDMLQQPQLCGGMPHVLDIFDEHAGTWTNEIIAAVDSSNSSIVKSRAGYILEERLRVNDEKIEVWKGSVQRGGSRKLDSSKDYAPDYSETWCISLNV